SVCVSLLQKTVQDDYAFLVKIWQERSMLNHTCVGLEKSEIKQLFPKNYQIPLVTQSTYELLKKIRNYKPAFSVSSSAGEIDMTKYRELFRPNGKYRVLHGAQIQKFYVSDTPSQGRINYLNNSDISSNTRAKKLFKSKRIVMQRITGVDSRIRLIMTVVRGGYLCANSTNYIVEDPRCPLEFTLGILNSKLINKYFKLTSTNTNITAKEINSIPLPEALNYREIVDLVTVINRRKEEHPNCDTSSLEAEIDSIVYKLYGLTEEEIAMVETSGS
ncbi:hypothetical protein KAR91_36475, partial [Candidatus Pacearchaeota archaeon]|nr:hypothetical protein [Candidatus Pacearchaeota archaeon]